MNGLSVYEVAIKLIGEICPYGDSEIDENRFNNQQELIILINLLLNDINKNAVYCNDNRWSVSAIGEAAHQYIKDLSNTIEL